MARCLTPQKICFLVLASLYCDAVLPRSATIPVLAFITAELVPAAPAARDDGSPDASHRWLLSLQSFEAVAAPHASNTPGRSLLALFLEKLWAIDSLDALHCFFDGLPALLTRPKHELSGPSTRRRVRPSRSSPLGLFIRRAHLEFMRLQFHDSSRLWLAFLKFRQPSVQFWKECSISIAGPSFDVGMAELALQSENSLAQLAQGNLDSPGSFDELLSTEDVERILSFQIDKLQRLGNRVPDDIKIQLRLMLGSMSTMPSLVHFARFFDAWRAGDYTSSFDSLHRYFDYTMQTRDKAYYQYALLHMAILHADFGCFSEAVSALNETIATARENHDMSCLNFSLSWLNHLAKAYPQQIKACGYGAKLRSERDGLTFLKIRAKETRMWSLLSSTLLAEAKMHLSHGIHVSRALENVLQSAHLNLVHDIRSNVGAQLLFQASLYGRLGVAYLTDVNCEVLLECYKCTVPVEDCLRAASYSAHMCSQTGRFSEAMEILDSIDTNHYRTLKFHQYITNLKALLKIKRDLRRSNPFAAAYLLRRMRLFEPSDPETTFQLALLEIEYLISVGSFSTALREIEHAASESQEENGDVYHRAHFLNRKALLFSKAGFPERAFSVAVRAACSAHRARLWPELWEAVGAIAGVLVAVGEYEPARKLGESIIPQALECGDEELCARLLSMQADAYMGVAGQENHPPCQRIAKVTQAEAFIAQAKECYACCENVHGESEMIAKQCIIAKLRGEAALSRLWAQNHGTTLQKPQQ